MVIGTHDYRFSVKSVFGSHSCILYKDGEELGKNTLRVYGRVWERYKYQTVMRGCVSRLIDELSDSVKRSYKAKYNIARLPKATFNNILESNPQYKEYKELLKGIEEYQDK